MGSSDIMKLPSWASSGQANINLQIPQNRDEMIKIILNKAAKPWYSMSEPVDTHLPAIIQPDPTILNSGLVVKGREHETKRIEESSREVISESSRSSRLSSDSE